MGQIITAYALIDCIEKPCLLSIEVAISTASGESGEICRDAYISLISASATPINDFTSGENKSTELGVGKPKTS